MTARPSSTLYFAQLMLDYLNADASRAAGVPDETTLPKIVLDSGTLQKIPGLVITAQEVNGSTHGKRVVQVVFALLYQNRASGPDAATDAASLAHSTLFIAAARMHDLIASRLADRAAFRAWLATRDTASEGVRLMHYRRLPDPVLKREDKPTPRHELMCAVELQALWLPQRASV